jgi:hypothetical protein
MFVTGLQNYDFLTGIFAFAAELAIFWRLPDRMLRSPAPETISSFL